MLAYIIPNEQGTYELEGLPAGDYVVCRMDIRNAPVLMEISLGKGEDRTIDFTPETVTPDRTLRGFLMIRLLTSDGIPLPCDFVLTGPGGVLTPNASQHARLHFVGAPGVYSLAVTYPGYKPLQRQVELQPVGPDGRAQGNFDVQFRLEEGTN